MPRPDLSRVASFFQRYISHVPQDDTVTAIRDLGKDFVKLIQSIPPDKYDYAYAPGKWTLKEVLQHIIDTERILSYRALCFSRGEKQSLPSFDENTYAENSSAAHRDWNDMVEEFITVRKTSEQLFSSFDKEQMERGGIANNNPLSVHGLGFIVAGHCQHHMKIIVEKYL